MQPFKWQAFKRKWLNWIEEKEKHSSLTIAVDGDPDNHIWFKNYKEENKMPPSWGFLTFLKANNSSKLIKFYPFYSIHIFWAQLILSLILFCIFSRNYKEIFTHFLLLLTKTSRSESQACVKWKCSLGGFWRTTHIKSHLYSGNTTSRTLLIPL